ncbi:MAG: YicC family protein [candidate division Zixibacteria bacterium]|nr:YicC family protein [candidate division Zixibacteria bacterium]
MILSMTGYGKAESITNDFKVVVEINSVNNRFLEVQFRLPKFFASLESRLKEKISKKITRGKVNYNLTWEENVPPSSYVKLNEEAAEIYHTIFEQLKKKFDLSGDLEVEDFINLPDLIKIEKEDYDLEKAWQVISGVTDEALAELNRMRNSEGSNISIDLRDRIEKLNQVIQKIEELACQNVESYRDRLQKRMSEFLAGKDLDEGRLAQEVAFMAERSDVTEECVRFRSHNQQFLNALEEKAPVGKRLTFLLQEMNREANTISSKALSAPISRLVIHLKEEIEKLREQIQNIE